MRKSKVKELQTKISDVEYFSANPVFLHHYLWQEAFLVGSLLILTFILKNFPAESETTKYIVKHLPSVLLAFSFGTSLKIYFLVKAVRNSSLYIKNKKQLLERILRELEAETPSDPTASDKQLKEKSDL